MQTLKNFSNGSCHVYLRIYKEKEMPLTLLNGKDVNIITLYRVVNNEGGIKKMIENDAWEHVAVKCGFDVDDAQEVKITYVHYIDLLEWYFDLMKKKCMKDGIKENEASSSNAKEVEDVKVVESKDEPAMVIIVEVTGRKDD
ncbi:putative transcription factor & chromatin remodeling ARID family [Helianthus anomalus]